MTSARKIVLWSGFILAGIMMLVFATVALHYANPVPRTGPPAASAPAPGSAPAAEPTAAPAPRSAPAAEPTAAASATDPQQQAQPLNTVVRMMRATDDADRQLLSELEQQTHAAPPAAVTELLALRRGGATREELQRFISERLASPLPVRIAAMHWLNAVSDNGAASNSQPAAPAPFGQGGGPRRVQPIDDADRPSGTQR